MRCQGSIWRWSPFFGICKSKFTGASGCTTNGANVTVSAAGFPSFSFCQCASGPSPRLDTIPMPVIHASRAASAIGQRLVVREANRSRTSAHFGGKARIGEFGNAEGYRRITHRFSIAGDARVGHGKTGAIMCELRLRSELLSRCDEGAQLRILDSRQKRHAPEIVFCEDR